MSTLKSTIQALSAEFAASIIGALRSASIDELLEVAGGGARRVKLAAGAAGAARVRRGKNGRLGRRSPSEIEKMIESVVALLHKRPAGMRAEQIREALGCEAKELPRPLADAVGDGRITKSGQKRATTYFVGTGGGGGAGAAASRRGKRGRKKRG